MTEQKNVKDLEPKNRNEGDAAHWLSTQGEDLSIFVGKKAPNSVFISDEIADFVQVYVDDINSRGLKTNQESVVDFENVLARCDNWSFDRIGGSLYIDDFKYGWGIVEPFDNWTMIAYAIGVWLRFPEVANFCREIVFTVHQPRPYHVDGQKRSHTIEIAELHKLYSEMTRTLSNLNEFLVSGDHCKNCEHVTYCSAARLASLNAVDVSTKAFNEEIPDHELGYELDLLRRAEKAIKERLSSLEELAAHKIKLGSIVPNYEVSYGQGHYQWNEGIDVDFINTITGKDISVKKLPTPAQAKKKGLSQDLVSSLSSRPNTGLKLKRVNIDAKAKRLFKS